ncbi:hypothetical protein [Arthrobacter psychrolactophilus]
MSSSELLAAFFVPEASGNPVLDLFPDDQDPARTRSTLWTHVRHRRLPDPDPAL